MPVGRVQIKAHTANAYCIEFDRSGKCVAVARAASCCAAAASFTRACDVAPVGVRTHRYFATGGGDGLVCVFDTAELACVRSFDRLECVNGCTVQSPTRPHVPPPPPPPPTTTTGRNPLRSVSFSFDGKYVACGSVDPFVAVQHVESGARLRAIQCGQATNTVAWHPRHYVLAFANDDPAMGASRDRGVVNVVGVPAN